MLKYLLFLVIWLFRLLLLGHVFMNGLHTSRAFGFVCFIIWVAVVWSVVSNTSVALTKIKNDIVVYMSICVCVCISLSIINCSIFSNYIFIITVRQLNIDSKNNVSKQIFMFYYLVAINDFIDLI